MKQTQKQIGDVVFTIKSITHGEKKQLAKRYNLDNIKSDSEYYEAMLPTAKDDAERDFILSRCDKLRHELQDALINSYHEQTWMYVRTTPGFEKQEALDNLTEDEYAELDATVLAFLLDTDDVYRRTFEIFKSSIRAQPPDEVMTNKDIIMLLDKAYEIVFTRQDKKKP